MTTVRDPLARRILDRIEEERLSPRPRWEFLARNGLFWGLGALSVALGAFAFSAALFEVRNAGWNYASVTHSGPVSFALAIAPYLWLSALVLFVGVGYVTIRLTKRGYRYPLAVLAIGAVLGSITLGSGLYAAGLGGEIEEALGDHPPFYRPIRVIEQAWWSAPDKGLLAGQVLMVATGTGNFILKDFTGTEWSVETVDLPETDTRLVVPGDTVRVVSVSAAATSAPLHACFIFPWGDRGSAKKAASSKMSEKKQRAESAETRAPDTRTELCKGIRPYAQLRQLEGGF